MSLTPSDSKLLHAIQTLDLPAGLQAGDIYEALRSYFSPIETDSQSLETLSVKAGKDHSVLVTSSKISNLKFRLKDFLLESLKSAVKAQSSWQNGLALSVVVLEFLQKTGELMQYTLSELEAKILLEMYKLEVEKEKITIDRLFTGMQAELSESQVREALDLLEKLACIRFGMDEIELVEEIIFVQQ